MSGVVREQLAICVVNGVLSGIGFALFDLKYWPLLALIAGVFSVVPIFGALLSSVPGARGLGLAGALAITERVLSRSPRTLG